LHDLVVSIDNADNYNFDQLEDAKEEAQNLINWLSNDGFIPTVHRSTFIKLLEATFRSFELKQNFVT
jgi:hypothetical protein